MMKKYFAIAAVATMFAACTNEDVTPQVDALTGTPIVVKTNVATPVSSRAVAGMDNGEDVTPYLLNIQGDTDYFVQMDKYSDDGCYAIDEDQNKTPCTMTWANSNQVTVSALFCSSICPPSDYRDGTIAVSVYADQSGTQRFMLSDKLYMPPTVVTPSTDGIEVNFQHLMSKVTITITGESEATLVQVDGTGSATDFSPSQGTFDNSFISYSVTTITACKDTEESTEGTSVYEVILVPQEVAANTFAVSFVMDGVTYQWTSAEAVTLESGKYYNIALTVAEDEGGETTGPTDQAILLKSITVAEWTPATGTLGGEAIEIVQ